MIIFRVTILTLTCSSIRITTSSQLQSLTIYLNFIIDFTILGHSHVKKTILLLGLVNNYAKKKSLPTHFLLSIGLRINKYSISKTSKYKLKLYNAPDGDASFYLFFWSCCMNFILHIVGIKLSCRLSPTFHNYPNVLCK